MYWNALQEFQLLQVSSMYESRSKAAYTMAEAVADSSVFVSPRLHVWHLHSVAEHLSTKESGCFFLYGSGPQVMQVHHTGILGLAASLLL